jgi:hypothetical protein
MKWQEKELPTPWRNLTMRQTDRLSMVEMATHDASNRDECKTSFKSVAHTLTLAAAAAAAAAPTTGPACGCNTCATQQNRNAQAASYVRQPSFL